VVVEVVVERVCVGVGVVVRCSGISGSSGTDPEAWPNADSGFADWCLIIPFPVADTASTDFWGLEGGTGVIFGSRSSC
jgi:hypothetical protein